jgi:hypothetical protein
MSAHPAFYISFNSPDNAPLPSVPSTVFGKTIDETTNATLFTIRNKCRVPQKYSFSADGKSALSDNTTLKQYILLTPENNTKLKGAEKVVKENTTDSEIPVIYIHLLPSSPRRPERPLRELNSKLQEEIRSLHETPGKQLDQGKLESISAQFDKLVALTENFATQPGSLDITEPADLTETQWENILFNNRILHGYNYDIKEGVLVKAPKRAFAIRRPARVKGPNNGEVANEIDQHKQPSCSDEAGAGVKKQTDVEKQPIAKREYLNSIPGVPPFYICDDATATVTEVHNAFQAAMAKEGFSSQAIHANL